MSYQVLARKWRPHTFKDLVGQEHVVQALVNGLDQDRVHHAFLLTGTRGVGKTTIARILAKCLNCEKGVSSTPCGVCGSCVDVDEGRFVDMLEIDAASKTRVDDTRELLETVQFTPSRGRYKVYIIDEVHMLSGHSFNALLKTLEEPPPHVKFVLATTDPHKLPITILSRCLRFSLTRLLPDQIGAHLGRILEAESIAADKSAVMRIARAADGSMRDGLSLLDQAIAYGGGSLKDADVANMLGSIDHAHVAAIIDALSGSDAPALMNIVNDLVLQSRNLESVLDELAEAMHRIALIQAAPGFRDPLRDDWDSLVQRAAQISAEDAQLYYQIAVTGRRDLGLAPDPRTGLEMTLLRMLAFRPAGDDAAATPGGAGPASVKTNSPGVKTKAANAPQSAQTVQDKPANGASEAARQARAAFDQMLNPKAEVAQQSPEPEVEPETEPDKAPQLEFGQQTDLKTKEVKPAPAEDSARDWSSLQSRLDLSGAVREFARQIQLESIDKNKWRFLVPDSLLHLGSKSVVQGLKTALSSHLGQEVKLDLHGATEPLKSVAAAATQAEVKRMSDAERAIEEDPTVQEIKQEFGAKIVPDSIQPIQ
jgi:DNA polymerase-3 subunit gamma/tau